MSYRLRKIRLLAVPAIVCLGLSACQPPETPAEPEASATESTTTSPTSSESSSPAPTASKPTPKPATAEEQAENIPVPRMPALAKENSKKGATLFAEHYFDIINYSTATTTTQEMKKLTTRQCELCATRLIDPIDSAQRDGAWQVGGKYNYELIDLIISGNKSAIAVFNFDTEEQQVYLGKNNLVAEWESQKDQIVSFQLIFDKGWKVNQLVTPKE